MTRYRITDPLLFWLAHLVAVPAVFIAVFFGQVLNDMFSAPGADVRIDTLGVAMAFGYALGVYVIGAAVTAIHAFGLDFWQRLRGGVTMIAAAVSALLLCGGLLLLAGAPAIARGNGAALLPGGSDFGVTATFAATALAFVAVFPIGLRLKLVVPADV